VGYSFGGAVAAEARSLDPRIKAAVNIDGRHWGVALEDGVPPPYLVIGEILEMPSAAALHAASPEIRYEAMLDQIDYSNLARHLRARGGMQVSITGATHPNLSDDALRSPIRRIGGGGRIDARRSLCILNTYVLAFFDQALHSRPSALLATANSPYPEVRLDIYPPTSVPY
jgi:pimeloyl-ACP methyl ester carboxylesterase